MTDKTVKNEIRGTVVKIFEYPVSRDKDIVSIEKGIIIQPDDKEIGAITEAFKGVDYSQFSVGQRVVIVTYTWKRPATEIDKRDYDREGMICPKEIEDFEDVIYDELSYYKETQSVKMR